MIAEKRTLFFSFLKRSLQQQVCHLQSIGSKKDCRQSCPHQVCIGSLELITLSKRVSPAGLFAMNLSHELLQNAVTL